MTIIIFIYLIFQTNGEPLLLKSGTIFIGKVPPNQDGVADRVFNHGFVGCIEQVSVKSTVMCILAEQVLIEHNV